ncbi:SUN domain-containing protein 1 isoform X1 [Cygnus atratus]|uniref:SUN domain-containing protein 1 isoform X1 n=2 Tax=Cygnus atratus TaxID=8868 RepID=UPI0015D5B7B2|nr:SUN domain-containing protein 1 isoform X1 [Cygnus atratus]XP_035405043.1 SUN domain-containing protein 1 isoform X1 [Cygnus atratus]XP_035405044.1 SUN domain-containing protein 1 isoform X1 [Cygnus atratus]XP_035405045.1 SUN domain-containing protein 1 isoform X1 [Cygnus atratus]XP_035405046.1 SUN domain-containing protein 1 isoform X1 [Cygnus atratus]XP_035405047.1 SUN domain-containing protein 1 isoform X1 [Cygnus atratus]XP_050569801.1 SUN domain-containing protein 1 isoform X1 [Cygnus
MDFSRLHMYTPPQCVPENTGYTYALSSSYSSDALDFEIEHKIDPVFDSPRMSRRSLRLAAAGFNKTDGARSDTLRDSSYSGNMTFREQSKVVRQRKSTNKQSGSVRETPRKTLFSSPIYSQSSFNSHTTDASMVSTVLDESSIREQTEVDHFWGLDDDGEPKGSDTMLTQGNGDIATAEAQTTMINGYTCSDCSMLSERKEALTARSASCMPSSRIYSRDRSQRHASRGTYFFMSKILRLVKHTATSFASLLVQLFQMVLLKLSYEFKAHSDYCGSMNVKEFYREDSHLGVNEESICDDCKGKKQLETYSTEHMQSSKAKRVARTISHTFSYAGYFMLHVLRTVGATGWLVSQKVLSLLWLAILSPGRAASGMFRLLRTGWYQLVTLLSLLKVFLLRRCLPKIFKLLLFVIPLLFLLGIWFWGFDGFVSLLPVLNWTRIDKVQRIDDSNYVPEPQPDSSHTVQPTKGTINIFDSGRISELEKQMALVSDRCHHHDEEYSKVMLLLHNLQDQVAQMGDRSEILKLIKNVMDQHLKEIKLEEKTDFLALHQEHELRIVMLEDLLKKLSAESEDIQKELDVAKAKTVREDEHNQLLSRVKKLELELSQVKSELLTGESVKTSCEKIDVIHEKVDAQVKESVKMMFFGDQHEDFSESLLQWLTSNFVTKSDLQTLLRDLELQILKNITQHMSVTNQRITSEVVTNVVNNAGISGITEAQAQIIVNNALKLYSQDKTGMVDFALESGGGSILSTRCSETYETKTALISLFGIPLWYFSQSPRVVIQPDMYPGNCWAFKGSEGYLVVRLSMKIYPTAFTMEHIPKTLSPSGNITSAPRNFSVYGLDDEYQEEGVLLGQYIYDQEGEPLQMFPVMEKSNNVFQIVELRILSNWGHAEYTCLYRFRVHGKPAE